MSSAAHGASARIGPSRSMHCGVLQLAAAQLPSVGRRTEHSSPAAGPWLRDRLRRYRLDYCRLLGLRDSRRRSMSPPDHFRPQAAARPVGVSGRRACALSSGSRRRTAATSAAAALEETLRRRRARPHATLTRAARARSRSQSFSHSRSRPSPIIVRPRRKPSFAKGRSPARSGRARAR